MNQDLIDPELLAILVCPESKEPVTLADAALCDSVNEAIKAGTLKTRGGVAVTDEIDAGLLREDGKYLYPFRDKIPVMLIDEAFDLTSLNAGK